MFVALYATLGVESKFIEEPSEEQTGNFYKRFLEATSRLIFNHLNDNFAIPDFRGWVQTS